jgi:hypothetical protein
MRLGQEAHAEALRTGISLGMALIDTPNFGKRGIRWARDCQSARPRILGLPRFCLKMPPETTLCKRLARREPAKVAL